MSKTLIIAAAAVFSCALAFAQRPSVVLQNHETITFYYVVDPKELAGLTAGSPLMASKVATYFSAAATDGTFSALAPQAETRLADLAMGAHLLVGFFAPPDTDDFPVRVLSLQVDNSVGERYYGIFASPAQLSVSRGVGKLAQFARTGTGETATTRTGGSAQATGSSQGTGIQGTGAAATAAAAGKPVPVIAAFADSYDPAVFTRETRESFSVLPIAQSRAWMQTGTRISSVQGAADASGLKVVLNVPGGFSPSVSYFLYVFDTRAAGRENPLTLEIEPVAREDRGACILWQKGSAAPRLIGTVKTGEASVEVDVGADEIAAGTFAAAGPAPTVDLTAGWYDKALGMWEEFYYATFPGPTLPVTR